MSEVISNLIGKIKEKSPLQARSVQKYLDEMYDIEKEKLSRRINYYLDMGEDYDSIADGYLNFCLYFMEERKYFVEYGTYRYSTYKEAELLYNDSAYMKNYMIGLSLAIYLWSIQRESMRFFVEKCRKDKHFGGKYLEVGPGHGEYLVTAMENMFFDEYLAVDISSTSAEMTRSFLKYVYQNDKKAMGKVAVLHKDFFAIEEEKFDGIVVSEVLEHVENPKDFLLQTKKLAKQDAFIYLSTAINSPFPDHLYHFHRKEEVYRLLKETGFKVVDEVISTAEGISMEKAEKKKYDITIGFILSPKERGIQ